MTDLTLEQLNDIREAMKQRVLEGLSREGAEIACLPAFAPEPAGFIEGQALVVDAGGTNLRVAWIELRKGEPVLLAGPLTSTLPDGRERPVDHNEFFGYQASLIKELGAPLDLPVGYCFSYPVAVERSGDARLLHWTKGIKVTGVEGELVGAALRRAMGGPTTDGDVMVINDTVASLLGGAMLAGRGYDGFMGLIVGTGTNIATFFPGEMISKVRPHWFGKMAVNFESGHFHPPHLTDWDEQLDAISDKPGAQRFEKAVSGYYLPKLFAVMCPDLMISPQASSEVVVEWADRPGVDEHSLIARWILGRAADLVAACLAGTADLLGGSRIAVQAEGGLFWKATGFRDRVDSTLKKLLPLEVTLDIVRVEDVNLMGAAAAALGAVQA